VDKGVLRKTDGEYQHGPHFDVIATTMPAIYQQVTVSDEDRETREWVLRGALIETLVTIRHLRETFSRPRTRYTREIVDSLYQPWRWSRTRRRLFLPLKLVQLVFDTLSFDRPEVDAFLRREQARNLIRIRRVVSSDVPPVDIFVHNPYWFSRDLRDRGPFSPQEIETKKESWRARGSTIYEEAFVFGLYRKEMVGTAREHLSSRRDLVDTIRATLLSTLHRVSYH
jgi:hypothetical protein